MKNIEDALTELSGATLASFCSNLLPALTERGVDQDVALDAMFTVLTETYPDLVDSFDSGIKAIAQVGRD